MSTTNSSEPDRPLKVGYILKMFPRLSETFILNEILELVFLSHLPAIVDFLDEGVLDRN